MTIPRNITATFVCAIGGFLFFAFFWPEYQYSSAIQEALNDRNQLIQDSNDALGNMQILNGEYETNKTKYDRMLVFMPANERSDYITASLQSVASQTGVRLSSIAIADAANKKKATDYQEITITLQIAGRYTDVLRFFSALEGSLRLYDITQINLSKSSSGRTVGQGVQGTVQILTYSLNTKQP